MEACMHVCAWLFHALCFALFYEAVHTKLLKLCACISRPMLRYLYCVKVTGILTYTVFMNYPKKSHFMTLRFVKINEIFWNFFIHCDIQGGILSFSISFAKLSFWKENIQIFSTLFAPVRVNQFWQNRYYLFIISWWHSVLIPPLYVKLL